MHFFLSNAGFLHLKSEKMGLRPRQFQKLLGDRCGKDRSGKLGTRRPNKNPSPPVQRCGGSKTDFPWTRVPGSRASPSLRESERDGGEGFGGNAAYRALAEPSRCPRVLALTLPATRSSCHASSFSAQQPYSSPRGSPPAAPAPPAPLGRTGSGGGSRGLYLACGACTVGAEARRGRGSWSWSLSWMEGTSQQTPPPRGRPSPDDTAARPPAGRPSRARARARALRPQYRDASLERPTFPVHQTSFPSLPNISRALVYVSFSTSCASHLLPALGPPALFLFSLHSNHSQLLPSFQPWETNRGRDR